MRTPPYTIRDASDVVLFLRQNNLWANAKIIGSIGRGKTSQHDIDILLNGAQYSEKFRKELCEKLGAKRWVRTDWGGIFLYGTFFGDIDIFFTDKDFDY